jgi:NADPH:quinone reductase-like Zn-dependent oxidoreductase
VIRAARIGEAGGPPSIVRLEEAPGDGDVVVNVSAFALNPIDVNVASGRFYGGTPPMPYVAGVEAVGRDENGRRVYLNGPGIGITRDGVWAERVRVPAAAAHDIPDGASDEVALACGVAGLAGWIPVTWRVDVRPSDRVLVLGATGSVGRVAVQAAKMRGAHVVAVGRRRAALEDVQVLGADEIVELGHDPFPEGTTVIVDALWGEPLAAALAVSAPGVRAVNVGQSAGAESTIASNSVRGKQAEIYGYSNYRVPTDVFERSYRELVEHAVAERVRFDAVETCAIDSLEQAWERQAEGPGAKLVVKFDLAG